jgi:hypothetical protein
VNDDFPLTCPQLSPQTLLKGVSNGKRIAMSTSSDNISRDDRDAMPLQPLRLLNQTNNNGLT